MGQQKLMLARLARRSARGGRRNRLRSKSLASSLIDAYAPFYRPRPALYHASMAIDGAEITSGVRCRAAPGSSRRRRLSAARLTLAADLLLPPVCISCRKRAGAHGLLCGDCWARIDFIAPPLCKLQARRAAALRYRASLSLSAAAIADPPVYDRARAAARYSSTMRDLIQSFKYGDRHEGVPLFGRWMAAAGAELARRRRRDRAGSALPVEALVAALQPVGHAGAGGRQADRRPSRLFPARQGQAHAKPGRAHGGAAARRTSPERSGQTAAKARSCGRSASSWSTT